MCWTLVSEEKRNTKVLKMQLKRTVDLCNSLKLFSGFLSSNDRPKLLLKARLSTVRALKMNISFIFINVFRLKLSFTNIFVFKYLHFKKNETSKEKYRRTINFLCVEVAGFT